jgi:hypothetical protein
MLIKLNIVKNYVLDSYFLIILNKKQIDYTQKINCMEINIYTIIFTL